MIADNQNRRRFQRIIGLSTWQSSPGAQPRGRTTTSQQFSDSNSADTAKTLTFWRLKTASHGAVETAEATTDPRPRVTKNIGNAQQTRVVSELTTAVNATTCSRCMCVQPLSPWAETACFPLAAHMIGEIRKKACKRQTDSARSVRCPQAPGETRLDTSGTHREYSTARKAQG
jgi:hypothetical protein